MKQVIVCIAVVYPADYIFGPLFSPKDGIRLIVKVML
jgi:hypothetical protein